MDGIPLIDFLGIPDRESALLELGPRNYLTAYGRSYTVDSMDQLPLFGDTSPKMAALEWPVSHRRLGRSTWIVSATVPGVGFIAAKSTSLWTATQDVRNQVRAALEASPSAMF